MNCVQGSLGWMAKVGYQFWEAETKEECVINDTQLQWLQGAKCLMRTAQAGFQTQDTDTYDNISETQVFKQCVKHWNDITQLLEVPVWDHDITMPSVYMECLAEVWHHLATVGLWYNDISMPQVFKQCVQHWNDIIQPLKVSVWDHYITMSSPSDCRSLKQWYLYATSVQKVCSALKWHQKATRGLSLRSLHHYAKCSHAMFGRGMASTYYCRSLKRWYLYAISVQTVCSALEWHHTATRGLWDHYIIMQSVHRECLAGVWHHLATVGLWYVGISMPQVFTKHIQQRNYITRSLLSVTPLIHECSHSMIITGTLSLCCPLQVFAWYDNISVP